jgi:hypothetical protein
MCSFDGWLLIVDLRRNGDNCRHKLLTPPAKTDRAFDTSIFNSGQSVGPVLRRVDQKSRYVTFDLVLRILQSKTGQQELAIPPPERTHTTSNWGGPDARPADVLPPAAAKRFV